MSRYFLPELGIVNALGSDRGTVLAGLLAGDLGGMLPHGPLMSGRSTRVGRVPGPLPHVPAELGMFDCRNNRLLLAALQQIEAAVLGCAQQWGPGRVAVVLGTSTSGIAAGEAALAVWRRQGVMPQSYHYRQQEACTLAEFAARYLRLDGLRYTVSTACSSSAKVFGSARRLLDVNACDAVLVGGCDSLCRLTLDGFDALESLAPGHCKPFSVNRDGINLGEGAAVFLVTREPAPVGLLGTGEASDGYHMSAPDPTGLGATLAIRQALADAGLSAGQLGYLNLHGTATPQNDAMESRVVTEVFGPGLPCSSTKPLIGHTLGAAGAQELGLCWLLLDRGNAGRRLPAHPWDHQPDPDLPQIGLTGADCVYDKAVMMSNSFAFGGSNASVIIGVR